MSTNENHPECRSAKMNAGKYMILRKWLIYAGLFIIAFGVRIALIVDTPEMNKWIDLSIYVSGGQLIANGVNPYDFTDNMELRDSLRRDTVAYNYYVDESQERWNFYSSGNMPLTLLYFGVIQKITGGNLFGYRIIFAIIDAILAVWVAGFILQYWQINNKLFSYLAIMGLGVLSPVILYHGTLLPEDKGLQILLIVSALHFAKKRHLILGALFLGWSITFKGFGVFVAPLCLYYFIDEPDSIKEFADRKRIKRAALFVVATIIFTIQPFILYMMEVFEMLFNRLDQNLNAPAPTHSSVWRFIYLSFQDSWQSIRMVITIIFLGINVVGVLRRQFGFNIVTASLLLWFVDISLLGGSLDRMNIGFVTVILLLGISHANAAMMMSAIYVFAGTIVFLSGYAYVKKFDTLDPELIDSAFSLVFTAAYICVLGYYAAKTGSNRFRISLYK